MRFLPLLFILGRASVDPCSEGKEGKEACEWNTTKLNQFQDILNGVLKFDSFKLTPLKKDHVTHHMIHKPGDRGTLDTLLAAVIALEGSKNFTPELAVEALAVYELVATQITPLAGESGDQLLTRITNCKLFIGKTEAKLKNAGSKVGFFTGWIPTTKDIDAAAYSEFYEFASNMYKRSDFAMERFATLMKLQLQLVVLAFFAPASLSGADRELIAPLVTMWKEMNSVTNTQVKWEFVVEFDLLVKSFEKMMIEIAKDLHYTIGEANAIGCLNEGFDEFATRNADPKNFKHRVAIEVSCTDLHDGPMVASATGKVAPALSLPEPENASMVAVQKNSGKRTKNVNVSNVAHALGLPAGSEPKDLLALFKKIVREPGMSMTEEQIANLFKFISQSKVSPNRRGLLTNGSIMPEDPQFVFESLFNLDAMTNTQLESFLSQLDITITESFERVAVISALKTSRSKCSTSKEKAIFLIKYVKSLQPQKRLLNESGRLENAGSTANVRPAVRDTANVSTGRDSVGGGPARLLITNGEPGQLDSEKDIAEHVLQPTGEEDREEDDLEAEEEGTPYFPLVRAGLDATMELASAGWGGVKNWWLGADETAATKK